MDEKAEMAISAGGRAGRSTTREYVESLVIAIVLALFIRTFVVQAFKIPSGSMIPTLEIGDHLLVNKFIYGVRLPCTDLTFLLDWFVDGVRLPCTDAILVPVRTPKRGDVIVFRFPKDESKDFIKRVIGVPGDTIQITHKRLSVNGVAQTEPYAVYESRDRSFGLTPGRDDFSPITVPPDSYFVMGDNRDNSLDSRFWGFVHLSKVRGKAILVYWSWDREATSVRWDRLADMIR
jgi:signal peptidase I